MKKCSRCKEEKSRGAFHRNKSTTDRLASWCKSCCARPDRLAQRRLWRIKKGQRETVPTPRERFLSSFTIGTNDQCWIYKGVKTSCGYGVVHAFGKSTHAHRYSFEYYVRKIKNGMELHHTCEIKLCVNPQHLLEISHKDHMTFHGHFMKGVKKTHCLRGHEYTEQSTYLHKGKRSCQICRDVVNKTYWNERSKRLATIQS